MLDPEAALMNAARWLRPGGKVLLFEPMEIGAHLMTAIYLTLLGELESDVDPRVLSFFKAMCHDYEARFGLPRRKPWTHDLDDKWFFHPSYLRDMAKKIGLTLELVNPINTDLSSIFSNQVQSTMNLAGLTDAHIPKKLWEIVNLFDVGISDNLKNRFSSEGIIILAKP
jgi:hypothetical protein